MNSRVMPWLATGAALLMVTVGVGTSAAQRSARKTAVPHPRAASETPGAAKLGTTTYAIPAGALFVATNGNDGASGSQAAPWKTLAHAVAKAPNRATIVMRAGIYRESVTISNKALTIQSAPGEAVIVRGSQPVTGFVKSGAVWVLRGWNFQFPRDQQQEVTAEHPLANAPDQAFFDGAPMTQQNQLAKVVGKNFLVDYAAHQLVIGIDPAGHTVEASTRMNGLHLLRAAGSVVKGIQFDHFATPVNGGHGAVLDSSGGARFENDIFTLNATAGLSVQGANTVVTHDTFSENGQLGLHGHHADGLHVSQSQMHHNNVEGFNAQLEAGGLKLTRSNNTLIEENLADANVGKGMWIDIDAKATTMIRNEAYNNSTEGLQVEISSGAIVAANESWHNGGGGIRIIESQRIDIYNNLLYQNKAGVEVFDGPRPQGVGGITLRNNIIMDGGPAALKMLDVDDKNHRLTGTQMGVTSDADAFCRPNPARPSQVAAWANGAQGQLRYTTLSTFARATGHESHGIACDGAAAAAMLADAPRGNFKLAAGSPGLRAGIALPANVATALKVAPGVAVDLGPLPAGGGGGPGPPITTQPVSRSVIAGEAYVFTADAAGRGTTQWQVSTDGGGSFSNVGGATDRRLSASSTPSDNGKQFRAVFTDLTGTATSNAATLTVNIPGVLLSGPATVVSGQPMTLTANASLTGVAAINVSGVVTFSDGATTLGDRTVSDGVASFANLKLDVGVHRFTAVYKASAKALLATSSPLANSVNLASTMTQLVASRSTVPSGKPLTLIGRVTVVAPGAGRITTGTVSFYDGTTRVAAVAVTNGRAIFVVPALSFGNHVFTAVYDGSSTFLASEPSPSVVVKVV